MCLFVGCVQRSHRLLSDAGSTAIAVVVVVIDSLSHTVPVHVTYHRLTISTSTLPRPCLFPRYPLPVAFLLYSFYSIVIFSPAIFPQRSISSFLRARHCCVHLAWMLLSDCISPLFFRQRQRSCAVQLVDKYFCCYLCCFKHESIEFPTPHTERHFCGMWYSLFWDCCCSRARTHTLSISGNYPRLAQSPRCQAQGN